MIEFRALCRMFNHAIAGRRDMPKFLSRDHDPLFLFERWRANLRILDVIEIKRVPYVPPSHPFVERLIGTIRRETFRRGRVCFRTRVSFLPRWDFPLQFLEPVLDKD
jgi:hypothetical protein